MPGKVRRIVTGVNDAGRSCIVSDTLLPTADVAPGEPVRAGLWTTEAAPASNKGTHDPVPDGVITRTPPAHRGGSVIRITDIAPDARRAYTPEDLQRRGCKTTPERSARHPGFHATDTVDYAICLEGEVWAVLDEDEALMRPGDVLIQRGTYHAWSNRSDRVCRMLFVLIDAEPLKSHKLFSSLRKDTNMPTFQHHGATIYYEEFGQGFPILTFAPAGLQSIIDVWNGPSAPVNPTTEFASSFRVIAMDQRNAGGKSRAAITAQDGWHTYAADHIALLDHLRIDRCHLYGQCIGGSFIMSLLKAQPQRIASAVLAQPIGRVGDMKPGRAARFDAWAKSLGDHPEATEQVLDTFYQNLYAPGFVYSVDRAFVSSCRTPCLVLAGNDEAHPFPISEEVAKLLPNADLITEWKTGPALVSAKVRIKEFLEKHTPLG